MWDNPKVGFTNMNKDGNLKDIVGIQVYQVKGVKIKKATKKGEIGKPRPQIRKGTQTID
jgi:hypothetical protein